MRIAALTIAVFLVGCTQAVAPRPAAPQSAVAPTATTSVATPAPSVATLLPTTRPDATSAVPPPNTPSPEDEQRSQARAALATWDHVIGDAPPDAIVFTSALTTLDHGWRSRGATNNKSAFFAGLIEVSVPMPSERPEARDVRWRNGGTQTVDLISASDALAEVIAEGDGPCAGCTPVHVVAARLTTHHFDTARGTADTPVWEFTLREDNVHVFHVAVANRITHHPESSHADIFAAKGQGASRELTVSFVGAKCCGEVACGVDYTGEPVESDLAVVVVIRGHSTSGYSGPCRAEGHTRTVTVMLAKALGDRTVLDIFGAPVPLCGPQDDLERSMCLYSGT